MKTHTEPHAELFKEIDDAISHSQRNGLPLKSIELPEDEWEIFVLAFETAKVAPRKLKTSIGALRKYDKTIYSGIPIYKEKS